MTPFKRKNLLPSPLILAGALLLAGCMNDDYDSSDIDMTMGFGTDGLQLPLSSTAEIPLYDIFDLSDDGCVVIDSTNRFGGNKYDYWFYEKGELASTAHPRIAKIVVRQQKLDNPQNISLLQSANAKSSTPRRAGAIKIADCDVHLFDYEGDKSDDVKELNYAVVESQIRFTIDPTAVSANVSTFDSLRLTFPAYFKIGNVTGYSDYRLSESSLTLRNVPSNKKLVFSADVQKFDFKTTDNKYGHLKVEGDHVTADGWVHFEIYASNVNVTADLASKVITSSIEMDDFTITEADGRFCPSVTLNDLGSVEVTGVPDFIADNDAKVDLYNPQILLTIKSDMEVPATINATLVAIKDGKKLQEIAVPGMIVDGKPTTTVCVCRTDSGVNKSLYDQTLPIPELSDLIKTIPDEIQFNATATADASKTCHFILGHEYSVTPSYVFQSPLAFAGDAEIVYNDVLDDWHSDIADMDIADDNDLGVSLTGTVENGVPAYLSVTVTPIDENGNDISKDITVKVTVDGVEGGAIKALNGTEKGVSSLSIEAKQNSKGGLNKLDGLRFTAKGTTKVGDGTPVPAVTLNANDHTLRINDIKVKIVGRYTADFN